MKEEQKFGSRLMADAEKNSKFSFGVDSNFHQFTQID